jgi:hypothetical protein
MVVRMEPPRIPTKTTMGSMMVRMIAPRVTSTGRQTKPQTMTVTVVKTALLRMTTMTMMASPMT